MNWAETVPRAVQGDTAAWEELYNATCREAYFVALKVCGNSQDAEDLTQEAYLTALEKLPQLQEAEKFPSWLYMIVANKCRDYLKKKKPALFTELQKDDDTVSDWADDREENLPEVKLDHQETVRLAAEMIDSLPEDQKLCLLLYYRDELSIAQIAQALQISEGTVKSRLNYGRQKVKVKVENLEKQGTKLYGLAPMPLLALLLRQESAATPLPAGLATASAAATATTDAAVSGAVTTVIAKAAGGLAVKIAAGLLVVGLAAGGMSTVKSALPDSDIGVPNVSAQAEVSVEEQETEAHAAYEELLRRGVTDSGLEIKYYAIFDLEKDGIPELLVANNPGTEGWLTDAQFYAYDGSLQLVGDVGSYYSYFYVVNNTYLRCMGRKDVSFVKKTGAFQILHTDDGYRYYTLLPMQAEGSIFTETAERLRLNPNQYLLLDTTALVKDAYTLYYPTSWDGRVVIEDTSPDDNYCAFYEAEGWGNGAGFLFSFCTVDVDDDVYLKWPGCIDLGTYLDPDTGIPYRFLSLHPTDVQFTPETQDTYLALYGEYEGILDSIQWDWRPFF